MKALDLVDPASQIVDRLLVPAEREADAVERADLVEAAEVVLEPRERGQRLRELMRRDAREDVIAREQDVVHLQADEARTVTGNVMHAIPRTDDVAVPQRSIDRLAPEEALAAHV